jgi:hypothetical protein
MNAKTIKEGTKSILKKIADFILKKILPAVLILLGVIQLSQLAVYGTKLAAVHIVQKYDLIEPEIKEVPVIKTEDVEKKMDELQVEIKKG